MNYSIYEDAITEDDDTFFEDLGNDFKEALCGATAVAGIEDVIGSDMREVWTVLGEEEPDGYDYDADEHTDVIERATNFLADELLESLNKSFSAFCKQILLNDGYETFWVNFGLLEVTSDIEEFNEGLQKVLEEIG
tara:strand:- start:1334 stop:1741 length:408 start_codon:yes stop_codon:yes gene_type:complete